MLYAILRIIPLTQKTKAKVKQMQNQGLLGINGRIVSKTYNKYRNTEKQLETDNIKYYEYFPKTETEYSKIGDQNGIIKLKQIHLIDLEHFPH